MAATEAKAPPGDEEEVVDAELIEEEGNGPGTDLAAASAAPPAPSSANTAVATLWNTHDPTEIIDRASKIATALKKVIDQQGMTTSMGGDRKHVNIEAWQTAGTLLGLQAIVVDVRRIEPRASFEVQSKRKKWGTVEGKRKIVEETEDTWTCEGWSYTAVAEVRTMDGRLIGRAEASCTREESKWARSDDYAVKSMAQTRACSKVLRQVLGFIIGMAGYQTTPAEEMPDEARSQEGPPFGRPLKDQDKRLILTAVAELLEHGDGPNEKAALEVMQQIKDTAGDYVPFIAAHMAYLIWQKFKELEPKPDAAAKAEADRAQAAPEQADPPPPESVDTPADAFPAGAAGQDDDIPF